MSDIFSIVVLIGQSLTRTRRIFLENSYVYKLKNNKCTIPIEKLIIEAISGISENNWTKFCFFFAETASKTLLH